ncbi:MAG: VCBS repeat-containing protein [Chitinophagaceae bacterium]
MRSSIQSHIRTFAHLHILLFFLACASPDRKEKLNTLFTLLPADSTGIDFTNEVKEDENVNPLQYENSYNGGGVAIGDLNNDGLDDVYFTSNRNGNRLFLNHGNFTFEDITIKAGVTGRISWSTGTTMADVNGDGLLDIYVCHSGNLPGPERANELFINNGSNDRGIPHFLEQAHSFGLADSAFSNQAAFFDYDVDGDLDMVLLNHSPVRFNNLDETAINHLMTKPDSLTGLKLYRNDKNLFKEVTRHAGIRNARLNFNLGVSVADINKDGLPDIYVSNDYLAPDLLFMNKGNGSFIDELEERISVTSQFSMGNDIADINNDGWPDIYTLDMLPEDNRRQKLLFSNDNFELFDLRLKTGLHAQYMRNMLHLSNGNGSFSEIGQLAGVSNTDWSWAPLFADFDNDGWKDLFVTNGYPRDYTNMDFQKFMGEYLRDKQGRVQKANLLELVKKMPASDVRNYSFQNRGGITFSDKSGEWGLNAVSNSNGAAYADLDNDGDLDLVVNNMNKAAYVYRNNARLQNVHNFLRIKLAGEGKNRFGIGAKVELFYENQHQVQEQLMSRGFQSSVSPVLLFGTGVNTSIDSLVVTWLGKKRQVIKRLACNQDIIVKQSDAILRETGGPAKTQAVFTSLPSPVNYVHRENPVNDFKRQPLLINSLSYEGPCMAKGDLNGDGRDDLFIGGAAGFPGAVFLQGKNTTFYKIAETDLENDAFHEDTDAVIFDANDDSYPDLFVASGGYDHFMAGDGALQSRLYLNDGTGKLSRSSTALPQLLISAGAVAAGDMNGDGHPDLFLGGRVIPGRYPETPASFILLNDGKGKFREATGEICPKIAAAGMFTSAVFADLDEDGQEELLTVGEWMPLQVWKTIDGKLEDKTGAFIDKPGYGWWNSMQVKDLNGDGKPDVVAGNQGLNCQWRAGDREPVEIYYKDFDDNGAVDPVFCYYIQGKSYPFAGRDELLEHISMMRTRFPDYASYANARISDIFTPAELNDAGRLFANRMASTVWVSNSSGKYVEKPLPVQAQFAPVYAISIADFNKDGKMDLLLGGNVYYCRVKTGINNSNQGQLFIGDGSGSFQYAPQAACGLEIKGEVRSFCLFDNLLFAGMNGKALQAYQFGKRQY